MLTLMVWKKIDPQSFSGRYSYSIACYSKGDRLQEAYEYINKYFPNVDAAPFLVEEIGIWSMEKAVALSLYTQLY